ncbi:MAG: glycerate kinase [Actinomycetales bacterium]|nr:glycerate kinase [Actinomycetales bacterium]
MSSEPGPIVIVMDKFKGCLTSMEAGGALAAGLREVLDGPVEVRGLADGGDGLVELLRHAGAPVETRSVLVGGEPRPFDVAWLGDAAVLESAQLVGLHRGGILRSDPMGASSEAVGLAVGELMRRGDAAPAEIIIGVGGTNCTDAGLGLLRGLGAELRDAQCASIAPGGRGLRALDMIDAGPARRLLADTKLVFATDVDAPMHGPGGAAFGFARQKGASADQVDALDTGLAHVGRILSALATDFDPAFPGLGAGGGMPAAACALLGARIASGADLAFEATGLDAAIRSASLVITGEGRFDLGSLGGKGPGRVVEAAAGIPVVVVAGEIDPAARARASEVARWYALLDLASSREDSLAYAAEYLRVIGRQIGDWAR